MKNLTKMLYLRRLLFISVLDRGGTEHQTMDQLARLCDVMSNTLRDKKLLDFVGIFDTINDEWKGHVIPFQLKHLKYKQHHTKSPSYYVLSRLHGRADRQIACCSLGW